MSALSQQPSTPEAGNANKGVERITGNFTTATSGAVAGKVGRGFTVTKVSAETGQYLVQCDKAFKTILHIYASLWDAADGVASCKVVGTPAVGDRSIGASFIIQTFEEAEEVSEDDTSGVTAPADLEGVTVSFEAVFTNVE